MAGNYTALVSCESIYYVMANCIFIGIAIFGVLTGLMALIVIPRLRLGSCPTTLLFVLALVDLIILALQVPHVMLLEGTYELFSEEGTGSGPWYSSNYARRLRLTLYFFEGWMVICLTLNRFVFVRWPYYDGKYMTSKCALWSVVLLALLTTILEAPAFGQIVMSQLHDRPTTDNASTRVPTEALGPTSDVLTTLATTQPILHTDLATAPSTELTTEIQTTAEDLTTTQPTIFITESSTDENFQNDLVGFTYRLEDSPMGDPSFFDHDPELPAHSNGTEVSSMENNSASSTVEYSTHPAPVPAAVAFSSLLKLRDTYVEVLDRFVTTLLPIVVVIPFLVVMAAMLPGGHPRMRTLSHDVIMERSAVVIMLTGVTWYVLANLPYQIYSLISSGSTARCHAGMMAHVTTITVTCALKPLIYFIVCPHFRRTLGAICSKQPKPKETFGTPSFDRISSRFLSSQDLNASRDSRDSQGSYYDIRQTTVL